MASKFGDWLRGIGEGGEGFMGKFGTGQGAISKAFSPVDRSQERYDKSKENVLAGRYDPQMGSQTAFSEDTGMVNINPQSGHQSRINTGQIDFSDPAQVENIQQILANEGYVNTVGSNVGQAIDVDSIWGQNTEDAYRDYINKRRESQGFDQYSY